MPTKVAIPRLKVFPDDNRIWRIDWLGAIRFHPHESSEPKIDVIISPLHIDQVAVFAEHSFKYIAPVGVGLLPFLRIGSLWLNGRPYSDFLGKKEVIYNVVISSERVSSFRVDSEDSSGLGFNIIPRLEYDYSEMGINTQCVSVKMGDDPYAIIIPAIELIRFYYAGSTNLTSLTLFGAYDNYLNNIINEEKSGYLDDKKRCVLQLRRWITDDDGWTIGRVLHEPLARAGVRQVYDSILPYSAQGKPAYPTCSLPFEVDLRSINSIYWKASEHHALHYSGRNNCGRRYCGAATHRKHDFRYCHQL